MTNRLISGQEYRLSDFFNDNRKIVIPDLQRDYCWGDKAWNKDHNQYVELVSAFLDNLISSFEESPNDNLLLGLIYGYEQPMNHIQLCDGQQRLTTLFLILGMINKYTKNSFKDYLISPKEQNDDNEPYLLYAIRESTLYFTSDLVTNIFIDEKNEVKTIKEADWYFKEYDQDPSIQSIISALNIISEKLVDYGRLREFGDFLINKILMLYYDMGNRTIGEETFVIINTTGEPLTASENLKPILIGNIRDDITRNLASNEWEVREEWFWRRKSNNEDSADEAHYQFFIWFWQILLLQEKKWKNRKSFDLNPIELFQKKPIVDIENDENPNLEKWEKSKDTNFIHSYFLALERLVEFGNRPKINAVLQSIKREDIKFYWFRNVDTSVILPLISYLQKFDNATEESFNQFVRKIRANYFHDKYGIEINTRKSKYVDWRHVLQIIDFSSSEQEVLTFKILDSDKPFKTIAGVNLNEWYDDDCIKVDSLKLDKKEIIEQFEDHVDFMGDISFLFKTAKSTDFDSINQVYTNFTTIIDTIKGEVNHINSNIYRLFLLLSDIQKIEHKPRMSWDTKGVLFSTLTNKSFLSNSYFIELCRSNSDELLNNSILHVKKFIDKGDLLNLNEENFSVEKALKCWLILKAFNAYKNNTVLSYYDRNDTGVSVYTTSNSNKLIEDEPFSIQNYICGFGVKAGGAGSYVHYTNKDNWLKEYIIDTPFSGIDIRKENRDNSQLEENLNAINEIIEYINNFKTN